MVELVMILESVPTHALYHHQVYILYMDEKAFEAERFVLISHILKIVYVYKE